MTLVLPFRRWVAHYGRWIATAGWMLVIDALWNHHYGRGALGLAVFALATWGLLLDADQTDRPRAFGRRNLALLMWWSCIGAVFTAALALWFHLDPEG